MLPLTSHELCTSVESALIQMKRIVMYIQCICLQAPTTCINFVTVTLKFHHLFRESWTNLPTAKDVVELGFARVSPCSVNTVCHFQKAAPLKQSISAGKDGQTTCTL